MVPNVNDIDARRQAAESRRDGEERLRLLFDSSADYIIILYDQQGLTTRWNKGAERALGFAEVEALGRPSDIIFTPEDRAAGAPADELRRARETGRAEDERWHLHKDGTRVYLSGVMVPLPSDAEIGYAKIARDLTRGRLAEQQRDALLASERSLRAQLEEANARKDEFLAVMSHELKNPLNLIALNAEMLALRPEAQSESLAGIARAIKESVRSQAQLIDDLLDLSRVQTGKLSLDFQEVRCDELVKRIVGAVQVDAQAKGIWLTLFVEPGDYRLHADPVRVEQIIWNLVSNALKFTPGGGSVRVSLAQEGATANFEVADTGQGIDPKYLPLIFEMFQQAGARATMRDKNGLGIGLAIVKRLVEAHGGQVAAASPGLGLGATFSVVLPRALARTVPSKEEVARSTLMQGVRTLVVEDDLDALMILGRLLETAGAVVTTASNAEEAITRAAVDRFDLIVSDIAMPGTDGYALLTRLRETGLGNVPAIALTGFARAGDRKRALEVGFTEHLAKPFDLGAFLSVVNRLKVSRST